jgi:hypothetical protein
MVDAASKVNSRSAKDERQALSLRASGEIAESKNADAFQLAKRE